MSDVNKIIYKCKHCNITTETWSSGYMMVHKCSGQNNEWVNFNGESQPHIKLDFEDSEDE